MQLVIDFYFLSICIQLYMFRASSAHNQESLSLLTASSFCVCVCLRALSCKKMKIRGPGNIKFVNAKQAKEQTEKLEAVCTVRDS
jgi:hypothetical protein